MILTKEKEREELIGFLKEKRKKIMKSNKLRNLNDELLCL